MEVGKTGQVYVADIGGFEVVKKTCPVFVELESTVEVGETGQVFVADEEEG